MSDTVGKESLEGRESWRELQAVGQGQQLGAQRHRELGRAGSSQILTDSFGI